MGYATVSDIETRWRTLDSTEQAKASALIDDASAIIDKLAGFDSDGLTEQQQANAKIVTCNMVIRAMSSATSDSFGLSQTSMTAGPYTQSWSYSNPSGDMYLTRMEKRLLGITSGYIGSIPAKIHHFRCCHD